MDYQPTFYLVADLARRLGRHITIFDLEATTFRGRPNFGITEVACFTVTPAGPGVAYQSLINPERTISPEASKLTGITQAMVRNEPVWGEKYAPWFQRLATESYLAGFNSATFDLPAVREMNERYGQPIEEFLYTFDVREMHLKLSGAKSRSGKLGDVAELYGVKPSGDLHRAMADVVLTLEILHRIIEVYGLETVLAYILPKKDDAVDKLTAASVAKFVKGKSQVSLTDLAKAFATEERLASFEVGRAIDERLVDPNVFANDSAQEWFAQALMELDTDTLVSGRLKPIYEALSADCPDRGYLDYVQLRIALSRANLGWGSLKPDA